MAARIVLVRHGRSSHVQTGWIDATGFRAWRVAYEAAGIREDERVPAPLAALMEQDPLLLVSDAARAIGSARLLAPGREVVVSPLLRELDLEAPSLGGLRFPLLAWALAVGGRTLSLKLRGQYPSAAETDRIDRAASWLEELAAQHPLIVAVTHAMFRQHLALRLVESGWRAEPGRRSRQPWSAWSFRQGGPTPALEGKGVQ